MAEVSYVSNSVMRVLTASAQGFLRETRFALLIGVWALSAFERCGVKR